MLRIIYHAFRPCDSVEDIGVYVERDDRTYHSWFNTFHGFRPSIVRSGPEKAEDRMRSFGFPKLTRCQAKKFFKKRGIEFPSEKLLIERLPK